MSASQTAYRIAVDCMGGDKGPAEVVAAVRLALAQLAATDRLVLVGREPELTPLLEKAGLAREPRIEIRHADEIVRMDDKPMQAIKSKKDASMIRALEMVKAGEADAMVSTGNTKVLVGAGTLKVRPLVGAERPALAAILPSDKGSFILVDAGANPESTPDHLVHNAVLGSLYAHAVLGIAKPRVGLLTVGSEEGKGGDRINKTHTLLKGLGDSIHYVGPVEGFDMFEDVVDVVVTDGFTGNVVLKSLEGLFYMVKGQVSARVKYNPLYWLGGALLYPMLRALRGHLKPEKNGGAPLLGLGGLVIKAHGSSNAAAIASAIVLARRALVADLLPRMKGELATANAKIAAIEAAAKATEA